MALPTDLNLNGDFGGATQMPPMNPAQSEVYDQAQQMCIDVKETVSDAMGATRGMLDSIKDLLESGGITAEQAAVLTLDLLTETRDFLQEGSNALEEMGSVLESGGFPAGQCDPSVGLPVLTPGGQ